MFVLYPSYPANLHIPPSQAVSWMTSNRSRVNQTMPGARVDPPGSTQHLGNPVGGKFVFYCQRFPQIQDMLSCEMITKTNGGFHKRGTPKWIVRESLLKLDDDWGAPLFWETSKWWLVVCFLPLARYFPWKPQVQDGAVLVAERREGVVEVHIPRLFKSGGFSSVTVRMISGQIWIWMDLDMVIICYSYVHIHSYPF